MSDTERMSITEFLESRIAEDEVAIYRSPKLSDPHDPEVPFLSKAILDRLKDECSSKRKIIAFHKSAGASSEQGADVAWATLNLVLQDMAHPYRHHPDFDPMWAEDAA